MFKVNLRTLHTKEMTPMQKSRPGFGICFFDGHIYVVGGKIQTNDYLHAVNGVKSEEDFCERYDVSTDSW